MTPPNVTYTTHYTFLRKRSKGYILYRFVVRSHMEEILMETLYPDAQVITKV
jgi:hypothetical protein